ncbi:hypothetical protein [Chitinophaga sp. CF418]|uniref:hypothetical protein n=1 Tax=Chitinophaga sp. CF418 TaxID=1855287 RepID=UPI00091342B8|nr:hypothetical protein [Chitinophaga sp. CF418]SHN45985.1 hypothetical protein SAMN05216311_12262 [Chitinophaga sp. CF418]
MYVVEIADELGFTDKKYFNRIIKTHRGVSPSASGKGAMVEKPWENPRILIYDVMTLFRSLLPCLFLGTAFVACSTVYESRVTFFNCGTQPDTNVAILKGHIFEQKVLPEKKDTLVPLAGAVITLEEGRKTVSADTAGAFTLYLDLKNTHPFTVTRRGYQPLTVEGFFAEKETLAEINIVLAKGTTERTASITACKIAY